MINLLLLSIFLTIQSVHHETQQSMVFTQDITDFWQTPEETKLLHTGDCEDFAFLFYYSLPEKARKEVILTWGMLKGQGHVWCEYQGNIIDYDGIKTCRRGYQIKKIDNDIIKRFIVMFQRYLKQKET